MKTNKKLCVILALACLSLTPTWAASKAKRVVMIALDGFSVEGFRQAKTPCMDALMAEGCLSMETRVVMPSVTLPNWTSHLTGSSPEQHGVVNNGWEIGKKNFPAVETDDAGYYPSVFKVLKEQVSGIKTAFYYNWINLFYPHNKDYFDEVSYLEDDAYVENYEKAFTFIAENRKSPTVVFLYTVHIDHAGHAHKWMSSEYIQAIEQADRNIGLFLEKMKDEGLYDDTHFMLLSDHGGIGYGHGGMSVDEMVVPWGIAGPGIKKNAMLTEPNNTVNTASVILRLFKVKQPLSWTGEVPASIFK